MTERPHHMEPGASASRYLLFSSAYGDSMQDSTSVGTEGLRSWLAGGGELGGLMRAKDWAATPLGPVEAWPNRYGRPSASC